MRIVDPPSERVIKLRNRMLRSTPKICADRALILTRVFQKHEHEHILRRWTLAFDAILREMTIYITDDEILVGNQASSPMAAPLFPEAATSWLEEDLELMESREQDPFLVPPQVKKGIKQILPYWQKRSMEYVYHCRRPRDIFDAEQAKAIRIKSSGGIGHHLLDLRFVLENGLASIKLIVSDKISLYEMQDGNQDKILFWKALLQTCDSIIAFAERFSRKAYSLASKTSDQQRKQELESIARICNRVPLKPAASFHEALQCIWFLTVIAHIFQSGGGITLGRLDQILQPYLECDLDSGVITPSAAQELLDSLWLKLQELNVSRSSAIVTAWAGYEVNPTVNIGGQTAQGEDATNALTYMCLAAEQHIHMRNPQLILRVHNHTPKALWRNAVEVMRAGGGKPSLISDQVCMSALARLGVPQEELLDFSIIGCAEPTAGDSRIMIRWSWLCLPKILELTLNNGIDPRTGLLVGLKTGKAQTFAEFEDLLHAFECQVDHQVDLITRGINQIADPLVAEMMPHLPFSLMTPSCIDQGLDVTAGGAERTWSVIWPIAPATTANALTAIGKVLFEKRETTWEKLQLALETDFIDTEPLRHKLINAPKFGNDDAFADQIGRRVVQTVYDAAEKRRNNFAGRFTTGFITLGANVHYGHFVGATADGRRAERALSDGMSPSQGTELEGPTATMKSVAKFDLTRAGSGGILNLKLNPAILNSEADIEKFIHLNETYLNDLRGMQVQYNIISTDVLRDAQAHPDAYSDLLVRVVGYCARFIDLSPEVQEDLIARTEHMPIR